MKKTLLFAMGLALLTIACNNRQSAPAEETPSTEAQETNSTNPYIANDEAETASVVSEDLSGNVIALSASEFLEKVTEINNPKGFAFKGKTPCIIDFYADWCRPCTQFKPVVESMAKKYQGQIIVYKVNVDKAQDICQALDIQSIPTVMFFRRDAQPVRMVGAASADELESAIQKFLNE